MRVDSKVMITLEASEPRLIYDWRSDGIIKRHMKNYEETYAGWKFNIASSEYTTLAYGVPVLKTDFIDEDPEKMKDNILKIFKDLVNEALSIDESTEKNKYMRLVDEYVNDIDITMHTNVSTIAKLKWNKETQVKIDSNRDNSYSLFSDVSLEKSKEKIMNLKEPILAKNSKNAYHVSKSSFSDSISIDNTDDVFIFSISLDQVSRYPVVCFSFNKFEDVQDGDLVYFEDHYPDNLLVTDLAFESADDFSDTISAVSAKHDILAFISDYSGIHAYNIPLRDYSREELKEIYNYIIENELVARISIFKGTIKEGKIIEQMKMMHANRLKVINFVSGFFKELFSCEKLVEFPRTGNRAQCIFVSNYVDLNKWIEGKDVKLNNDISIISLMRMNDSYILDNSIASYDLSNGISLNPSGYSVISDPKFNHDVMIFNGAKDLKVVLDDTKSIPDRYRAFSNFINCISYEDLRNLNVYNLLRNNRFDTDVMPKLELLFRNGFKGLTIDSIYNIMADNNKASVTIDGISVPLFKFKRSIVIDYADICDVAHLYYHSRNNIGRPLIGDITEDRYDVNFTCVGDINDLEKLESNVNKIISSIIPDHKFNISMNDVSSDLNSTNKCKISISTAIANSKGVYVKSLDRFIELDSKIKDNIKISVFVSLSMCRRDGVVELVGASVDSIISRYGKMSSYFGYQNVQGFETLLDIRTMSDYNLISHIDEDGFADLNTDKKAVVFINPKINKNRMCGPYNELEDINMIIMDVSQIAEFYKHPYFIEYQGFDRTILLMSTDELRTLVHDDENAESIKFDSGYYDEFISTRTVELKDYPDVNAIRVHDADNTVSMLYMKVKFLKKFIDKSSFCTDITLTSNKDKHVQLVASEGVVTLQMNIDGVLIEPIVIPSITLLKEEIDGEEEWCVFRFAKAITHPTYKDRLLYGNGGVDVWVRFFHESIDQLTHDLTMFKYVLGALKDGKAAVEILV